MAPVKLFSQVILHQFWFADVVIRIYLFASSSRQLASTALLVMLVKIRQRSRFSRGISGGKTAAASKAIPCFRQSVWVWIRIAWTSGLLENSL